MTTTLRPTGRHGNVTVDGTLAPPAAATTTTTAIISAEETVAHRWARYFAAAARISLGWIFLWAFLDKALALGHDTGLDPATGKVDYFGPAAWIHGASPTEGFLGHAVKGPLASFYQTLAGNPVVDWAFMLALLGIGVALILGVGMRIAAVSGAALLVMMWSAVLAPANNPFMDEHLIYALVLGALAFLGAGKTFGLGKYWERIPYVRDHGLLK
jgi:thiosulfate dehydrogenase (quinone) large subunit